MKALAVKKSLIVLQKHRDGVFADRRGERRTERRRTIQQIDLEEFLLLKREMRESIARWKAKRDYLKQLLEAGARVEPGVHRPVEERRIRVGDLVPTEYRVLRVN